MTDPAKIAATLTEAEKDIVLKWRGPKQQWSSQYAVKLREDGLLDRDWHLSGIGHNVRDHLLSEQSKPEPAREFRVGDMVRHVNAPIETTMIVSAANDGSGYVLCCAPVKNHTVTQEWRANDLTLVPDPAAETSPLQACRAPGYFGDRAMEELATETFFAPDYVTPVGEPVEPDNPRAFPSGAIDDRYGGMTLRDWFAGQALAGIGAWAPNNPDGTAPSDPKAMRVKYCYKIADAMLAERVKP